MVDLQNYGKMIKIINGIKFLKFKLFNVLNFKMYKQKIFYFINLDPTHTQALMDYLILKSSHSLTENTVKRETLFIVRCSDETKQDRRIEHVC